MAISFGNGLVVITLSWTEFKSIIIRKYLQIQHEDNGEVYSIFAIDSSIVYICTIYKNTVPDNIETNGYSQNQNDLDKTNFETNYKEKSNYSIQTKDIEGRLINVNVPRVGKELIAVTHNLSDPTTWYSDSVRVDDEILTSNDGYTWQSININWIDLVHGKIFDEDSIKKDIDHHYDVIIKIDNIIAEPREPYATDGGDYIINYKDGYITFLSDQNNKTITASYSYENGSTWYLIPDPGKKICIEEAEAQFSSDVIISNDITFEIWVYNPYDLPNKFMYDSTSYKKITNFIDEALGSFPIIPAIGGIDRGTQNPVYGFPFRYGTVREALSSQGIELRVKIKNDQPFGGEYCTATFYCTVTDE